MIDPITAVGMVVLGAIGFGRGLTGHGLMLRSEVSE